MDFKNFIDWKSFIMGAAFASFICVVASQYQLDWLYAFAAIGLLYVGYKAKNMKWGAILGAIAATPLFVLAAYGVFGPLSDSSFDPQVSMFVTLIAVLMVGALVGFVGAYTYRNRQRAIAAKEKQAKTGKNKKGKNTTTTVELFKIDCNSYIADTPGFSTFDIYEIESNELDKYFKDFHNYIPNCEYIGCNHVKEVNCGIKDAVASGQISEVRYQSYCKIYNELKQKEENKW